jgi:predicted enzyme related to lactoylglutathione lyase
MTEVLMTLHINTLTIDCHDPHEQARFWSQALAWELILDPDGDPMIVPTLEREALPGAFPILFLGAPGMKDAKNRLHLDLAPEDQSAEVARLERLGATRVDIGQKNVSWVVMADPEGNEFCVLKSLAP